MHTASPHTHHARKAKRQWEIGLGHAKAARWGDAALAHATATRLAPRDAVYALNHARALLGQGLVERAGNEAWRAFDLDPTCLPARDLACECLMQLQRFAELVTRLHALGSQSKQDFAHHAMLGAALHRLGRPQEAISAFFDALSRKPEHAASHHNLGLSLIDMDRKQEAVHCLNTALLLGLGPQEVGARGLACFTARNACDWSTLNEDLALLRAAVCALPADAAVNTSPFAHLSLSTDRADQLHVARISSRWLAANVQPLPAHVGDWRPGSRRLKVGYVSSDFHAHATSILMAEMLEQHDRNRFEVTLYSHGPDDGSTMRERIESACEHFIDARSETDMELAKRIRADGIDLLIDLKGHTREGKMQIFAYRAAPLQASFLGFPGSTGADYMDYVIGDPVVTPLSHAGEYSEKIAQMPICYQPNDRQRPLPTAPTRASEGLPEDALVLCGFNQPYKISPEVFDSWCRLLHALPGAVLWLMEWSSQALPNLRRQAELRGIDPARLVGAPHRSNAKHLARQRLADLFIDTWPYNAHTTASDALWAGVPVVTFVGETFASRVCASLLNAVGMPELVCADQQAYEAKVIELATDAPARIALRERLGSARTTSPLFDSLRFTRDIEALFLRMAQRHSQGLAPAHLAATEQASEGL